MGKGGKRGSCRVMPPCDGVGPGAQGGFEEREVASHEVKGKI